MTVAGQQLGVASLLDNPSTVHHHDDVGVLDGGKTMRNAQRGAPIHQGFQGILHQPLALGVEGAGGFVQDQNGRVLQDRAGNGQSLTLTAAQTASPFADHEIVAALLGQDELVGIRGAGRRLDLGVSGPGAAEAQVVADGLVEQNRLLRDDGDLTPQVPGE